MASYVPSIWDYLGQAGQAGVQNYTEAKQRVEAQNAQALGLLTQLFGAGAIDAAPLEAAIPKVKGMPVVKVQPNKAEQQRKILANPAGASDDARRLAGLPTRAEATIEAGNVADAQGKINTQKITERWQRGEVITEEEAALAKLPTKQEFAQIRNAKADPILKEAGDRYVDQEVLRTGGRINPSQASQLAQRAYQQYVKDYQAAGLGTLTPAQLNNAQSYFASRAIDILTRQRQQDISAQAASGGGVRSQDRMFQQLTSLMENNRKTISDFLRANPGAELMAAKPDSEVPPAFKGMVTRYRRLMARENQLQEAQSSLAAGIIPKNFSHLLTSNV